MLDRNESQKVFSAFGLNVISEAKKNFKKKNASGKGSRSLNYDLDIFENSMSMDFLMEKYMEFQDKGVSGTERKFNTPFSYTNKRPPTKAFDKWVIRRGLAARDKSGRFLSRENLKFALANFIYRNGIRPSNFFTDAFERNFRDLPDDLVEAYGLDVEQFMKFTLKAK